MKLKNLLEYSYSSTQIDFPNGFSGKVINYGRKIVKDKDLYIGDDKFLGRQDDITDIHVTVLYGIEASLPNKKLNSIVKKYIPFNVVLGKISKFDSNPDYDVLIIEVSSKSLKKLHYEIEDQIENGNTFKVYKPHVTIAYVNKGKCENSVGDKTFDGKKFTVNNVVFSSKDNDIEKINIKGKQNGY